MRLFLCAMMLALAGCASVPKTTQTVPVLMYHQVNGAIPKGEENVGVQDFVNQLKYLHDEGYTTVTVSKLAEFMRGGKSLPQKSVAITFDDGWRSSFTAAMMLAQMNDKATFYIISHAFDDPQYISKDELTVLSHNPNFEIGAHTQTHFMKWVQDLKTLPTDTMKEEVSGSKTEIEQIIGQPVKSLSWPFGYTRPEVLSYAESIGYTSTVLVGGPPNKAGDDPLKISRLNIDGRCSFEVFRAMIKTRQPMRCDK